MSDAHAVQVRVPASGRAGEVLVAAGEEEEGSGLDEEEDEEGRTEVGWYSLCDGCDGSCRG